MGYGLKVGIVGLPNVGKSTLFNALLKKRVALSANYPFATVEPNVGVVAVPDERLEKLADMVARSTSGESPTSSGKAGLRGTSKSTPEVSKLPPIVPAVVEFVDIAGLVKGASKGEGLGNQFLAHIREVDAIVHVLRGFQDENVVRAGAENPEADREVVETELKLADLQTVESAKGKSQKSRPKADQPLAEKIRNSSLEKLEQALGGGIAARDVILTDEERKFTDTLFLLTAKPVLYVLNVDEKGLGEDGKWEVSREVGVGDGKIAICAKLEEELADLDDEERVEYLKSVGLNETGLEKLIREAYNFLGLISFLTAGPKEVRAWTIKSGTKAPQAAGVIHSDFEKNFIRAQVISYNKLIEASSYAAAKQNGWVRMEGRDYAMQDGDVVEFMVGS